MVGKVNCVCEIACTDDQLFPVLGRAWLASKDPFPVILIWLLFLAVFDLPLTAPLVNAGQVEAVLCELCELCTGYLRGRRYHHAH